MLPRVDVLGNVHRARHVSLVENGFESFNWPHRNHESRARFGFLQAAGVTGDELAATDVVAADAAAEVVGEAAFMAGVAAARAIVAPVVASLSTGTSGAGRDSACPRRIAGVGPVAGGAAAWASVEVVGPASVSVRLNQPKS